MALEPETLETERLVGRPPRPEDYDDLRLIHADPRATATLTADGEPFGENETRAVISRISDHFERHGFGAWFWFGRESGDFVGYCGLKSGEIEGNTNLR